MTAFVNGFIEGLRTPLDKTTMTFIEGRRIISPPPLKVSNPDA
jgi:hypothetical protein